MGKFTVIPENTFNALQLDAGVLLKTFNPANPVRPQDADIITATTGGITVSATPTFSDLGEDVDNVPNNMKEFKHLDSWDMSISTTGLGTSPELIKMALGCADIDGTDTSKIVPRKDLLQTDFASIWWVGDRADGGMVAVQLKNALATSGFTLTTTKNGKGTIALTLTGHVSINAQNEMPMVFYSSDPEDEFTVTQTLSNAFSTFTGTKVNENAEFEATITAPSGYTVEDDDVSVTMGTTDITSTAWDGDTSKISIASVTGNLTIAVTGTAVE